MEPQTNFVIDRAAPEDVHDIQEVFMRTWLHTYPNEQLGITQHDIRERFRDAFSPEILQQRMENIINPPEGPNCFVARDGNTVVGLCRSIVDDLTNKLTALYVLPEYQGKGIGTMLWNKAKETFDPSKDTVLSVATYNTNAIDFYKKLGFVDTGRRFSNENFQMKNGTLIPEMEMIIKAYAQKKTS